MLIPIVWKYDGSMMLTCTSGESPGACARPSMLKVIPMPLPLRGRG